MEFYFCRECKEPRNMIYVSFVTGFACSDCRSINKHPEPYEPYDIYEDGEI